MSDVLVSVRDRTGCGPTLRLPLLLSTVCLPAMLSWAAPAAAQDRAAAPPTTDEVSRPATAQTQAAAPAPSETQNGNDIIVTARRREESLQRVPVSVTVATPRILQEQQIIQAQDLQRLAPSLAIVVPSVAQQQSASFTIRGQGQSFGGALPSVIAYFSEVPLDPNGGASFALYDIDSIQVLRGPQGTLFGRNTNGGAVLLTPTAPSHEFGGYVDLFIGNYDYRELRAAVNVPLGDTLAFRAAGNVVRRDGYIKNLGGPDFNNQNSDSWRFSLRWDPSSSFRNDLIYSGQKADETGSGYVLFALRPGRLATTFNGGSLVQELAAQQARGPFVVNQPFDGLGANRKIHLITDTATFEISDSARLRAIGSYQRVRVNYGTDFDGTTTFFQRTTSLPNLVTRTAGVTMYPDTNIRQLTGELQLSGSVLDDRLDYQVGGFILDSRSPGGLNVFRAYRNGASAPSNTTVQHNFVTNQIVDQSRAIYTQETLHLGDNRQFSLTAGLRYTWDRRAQNNGRIVATVPIGVIPLPSQYVCQIPTVPTNQTTTTPVNQCFKIFRRRDNDYGYNLTADWQINPDLLVYAATRRGFKDGGINNLAFTGSPVIFYDPEVVTDYEAGVKWTYNFGAVRGRFNIDAFTSQYKGIQRQILFPNPAPPTSGLTNADGRIRGIEAEGLVQLGEFSLSGGYSHLTGRYKRGTFIDNGVDVGDSLFQALPKDSGNITAAWQHPLGDNVGTLSASGTLFATSRYAAIANNVLNFEGIIPGYHVFSARVQWGSIGGSNLDFAVFCRNCTDETYRQGGGSQGSSTGISNAVYGEPRTYGVEAKYRF